MNPQPYTRILLSRDFRGEIIRGKSKTTTQKNTRYVREKRFFPRNLN